MKNQIKKSINVITNYDLGLTKSTLNARFDVWERALLGILYDQITIGKSNIDYLLNPKELPEHDYRVMKATDFINMLNKKLPGFGEIGSAQTISNPHFLKNISKIVGTHLILAIDKNSNKIKYLGGIKYKILFIDENILNNQNNLIFNIYPIDTINAEFAEPSDERWLSKRAAYLLLTRTIRALNVNVSEHTRSILRLLYAPVALESPETLCGLCKPYRADKDEIEFKETDLTRINSIRGSVIFNSHDLETLMVSELKPEYDYYVFRILSSIEKNPTKDKMVLHISGFTGYMLDPEINKIQDLTRELHYFEVYMRRNSHIDQKPIYK